MAWWGMLLGKPPHAADGESIWGSEQRGKDASEQKLLLCWGEVTNAYRGMVAGETEGS